VKLVYAFLFRQKDHLSFKTETVDYFDITSDLKHTSVFAKTGPKFYLSQQRFTCRNNFSLMQLMYYMQE